MSEAEEPKGVSSSGEGFEPETPATTQAELESDWEEWLVASQAARQDNPEDGRHGTVKSFVITKTYSSEHLVVILNLRKDLEVGEWVLDKTISQGLPSKTFGGIVDIDRYNFLEDDKPLYQIESPSSTLVSPAVSQSPVMVPEDLSEVLKKMDACVAQMNKDIQAAREMRMSYLKCEEQDNEDNLENDANDNTEQTKFSELPFLAKLGKMFNLLITENEPCVNQCDRVDEDCSWGGCEGPISSWVKGIIKGITNYSPPCELIALSGNVGPMMQSEAEEKSNMQNVSKVEEETVDVRESEVTLDPDSQYAVSRKSMTELNINGSSSSSGRKGSKSRSNKSQFQTVTKALSQLSLGASEEEEEEGDEETSVILQPSNVNSGEDPKSGGIGESEIMPAGDSGSGKELKAVKSQKSSGLSLKESDNLKASETLEKVKAKDGVAGDPIENNEVMDTKMEGHQISSTSKRVSIQESKVAENRREGSGGELKSKESSSLKTSKNSGKVSQGSSKSKRLSEDKGETKSKQSQNQADAASKSRGLVNGHISSSKSIPKSA